MIRKIAPSIAAGIAALAAGLVLSSSAVMAQTGDRGKYPEKHDSNTLHKIGKAIQYPVRKAGENISKTGHKTGKAIQYPVRKTGENASIAAHQAAGQPSIRHNRHNGLNEKVLANGDVKTIRPAHVAHRKHAKKHHIHHHKK